jgi:hypothetical protein
MQVWQQLHLDITVQVRDTVLMFKKGALNHTCALPLKDSRVPVTVNLARTQIRPVGGKDTRKAKGLTCGC